jgi:Tfp pilus assembly protein PilN
MINLLPPVGKKDLLVRKKLKLVLIFEIGLTVFLLSALLCLFSITFYLKGEIDSQKSAILERKETVDTAAVSDLQKTIKDLNRTIGDVAAFYKNQVSPTLILQRVSVKLPQGGYLTNFSLHEELGRAKINLSGFINNREELLEFKKSLEAEKTFKAINFPPSNWVLPTNIDFYLSFETK